MSMTRTQFRQLIQGRFRETLGSVGAQDTFLLDAVINDAADETARATNSFAVTVDIETVANQPIYTAPNVDKIEDAFWTDTTSTRTPLRVITAENLTQLIPNWRDQPAGSPRWYITRGTNIVALYPTPNASSLIASYTDLVAATAYSFSSVLRPFVSTDVGYTLYMNTVVDSGFINGPNKIVSVAGGVATMQEPVGTASSTGGVGNLSSGGISIEGLGVPGNTWPNPSDLFPLPDRALPTASWRACVLRCRQFPVEYAAFLPGMEQEWVRAKGILEAQTSRLTKDTKGGIPIRRQYAGW